MGIGIGMDIDIDIDIEGAPALVDVVEVSLLSELHPASSSADAAAMGIRLAPRTILGFIVVPRFG
ncbi:hypothetical protein ACGFIU_12585 [Rhodococcus oryzae]|uniref:hypothetical protein n=1 Tax=Rhodococcus oryzae TaxID=2571143 RepID=UPI003714323E